MDHSEIIENVRQQVSNATIDALKNYRADLEFDLDHNGARGFYGKSLYYSLLSITNAEIAKRTNPESD